MKSKVIALLVCCAMILSVAGCGSSERDDPEESVPEESSEEEPIAAISKDDFITAAKALGNGSMMEILYLSDLAVYEMNYAAEYGSLSEDALSYAYEQLEAEENVTESDIYDLSVTLSEAYDMMSDIPDEEAQEWYDATVPLFNYVAELYLTTVTNIAGYDDPAVFMDEIASLNDEIGVCMNTYTEFSEAHSADN